MKLSSGSNIPSSPDHTFGIEIPKKPAHKSASEHRRATKPIMEKRRRARINHSLNELKSLILDALNKDPSRHSKLEKADILEMTVRYLQTMQRRQNSSAMASDPSLVGKFRTGFSECASEVSRYMNRMEGLEGGAKSRVAQHLSRCVSTIDKLSTGGGSSSSGVQSVGSAFPGHQQHPLAPTSTDFNNNNNNQSESSKLSSAVTPPASASSNLFTFTFPPQTTNLGGLHPMATSPMTPMTPSTPSSARGLSINISYGAHNHHHQEQAITTASSSSWSQAHSPVSSAGSISPGSLRSLTPMASECFDEDSMDVKQEQLLEDDQNVWRPW